MLHTMLTRFTVSLALLGLPTATPCTTVLFPTGDGATVIGRTMELAIPPFPSELEQIFFYPRGTAVPTLRGSLNASKYGFLAVQIVLGNFTLGIGTTEGMNEAGLTISLQTHVGAAYESENRSKAVSIGDLTAGAFMLGCCATVDEAASALALLNVQPTPVLGHTALGKVHWSIQDAQGSSRALEYIDGALRVYDNAEVGVLTNDPSYEWHLGNLNQYASFPTSVLTRPFPLTATSTGPFTTSAVQAKGGVATVPTNPSHGLNTRLLPGSFTPPDRFVKMFLLKQLALAHAPPATVEDGIVLATGLLNSVHIPRGAVAGSLLPLEYTNWAVLKVPRSPADSGAPLFFYRTYDNMQWKRVDLSKIDWSGAKVYDTLPVYEPGLGVREVAPRSK